MLPPVVDALQNQRGATAGESEYVFLNQYRRPVLPVSVNTHVWKPALEKAELEKRRLYETRHTFATHVGCRGIARVQKMTGHETLRMIHDQHDSYIKNHQRNDGSASMEKIYQSLDGDNGGPSVKKEALKRPRTKTGDGPEAQSPVIIAFYCLICGAEGGT